MASMHAPIDASQSAPPHSENVEEELHRIHLALNAVFSPTTASAGVGKGHDLSSPLQWWEKRQLADMYVTSFQTTSIAWMVCDRLLLDQAHDSNVAVQQQRRFFAAQTLHMKCRERVHELPQTSLPSLRDSLLAHLQRYSNGSNAQTGPLTTRLAMCVSALAVQMGWTTILDDLVEPYTKQTQQAPQQSFVISPEALLSLLTVLPEECASDRLLLFDEGVRYVMRDHLVNSAAMVFSFLHDCCKRDIGTVERVLMALHTWVRYVHIMPQTLTVSPLLEASVHSLFQPNTYLEVAADVVVELLRMYPSHISANRGMVEKMIPLLSNLPLDAALASDDEDVWKAYCRIVTEMGESYMSLILSQQEAKQSTQIVDWVLKCSTIVETEIASITLHFWYRMVMDLEGIDPYDLRQELIDIYTPHLLKLIDICATHLMKYPSDFEQLADDRIDDLHRDRFYVAETVEDCCRLLGGQVVLQRIGNLLHQECQRLQQHPATGWQAIEACLACIQSMHRFIPGDEHELLPFLFHLIPQLPPNSTPLRSTASKTIGKYASWIVLQPNLLQPLMPYLAQGLQVKDCAPSAAVAIKELCECSNQAMPMGEAVLQLYQEIADTSQGQVVVLELNDELQILEGVCLALSRQIRDIICPPGSNKEHPATNSSVPDNGGKALLARIVQPIGKRLTDCVAASNVGPKDVIPEIERLTTVVQHLSLYIPSDASAHPMVELIQSCWALLDAALQRFPSDYLLSEKVCRLHKHALRTCGAKAYAPMLEPLLQMLIQNFAQSHQSPFLYLASICVAEYGRSRSPDYSERLLQTVSALSTASFSFLQNMEDLTSHPDIVEELFYLMGRMVTYCPEPLILTGPGLLQQLFQCAAVGMQLHHRDANKGTLNFLENTVSYGLSLREQISLHQRDQQQQVHETRQRQCQAALEHVLVQEGQKIVTNLTKGMMGEIPTYSNQVPELLWKLNLLTPSGLAEWLSNAFNLLTVKPPENARMSFLNALSNGLPRNDFQLAVRGFMDACERERRFGGHSSHRMNPR